MTWQANIDLAIQYQLFRRVALEAVSPAGALPLGAPGTDGAVDEALRYANTSGRWLPLGQQLAHLRRSDGYFGTYLGRGITGALHVVTVEAWRGQVDPAFFEKRFSWVWPIFGGVAELAPAFKLPMEDKVRAFVQSASSLVPQPLQPYLGVAGSLANLLLAVSESSGAAIGIFVLIDSDGMSPEMRAYADRGWHAKGQNLSIHTRALYAVAVDIATRTAHGRTPPRSLDLAKLNASLQGAQEQPGATL